MTIDQHIAELRAELAGCIFDRNERTAIAAELEQAVHRRDRLEDEHELEMLAALESDDDLGGFGIDPEFDDVPLARELALA